MLEHYLSKSRVTTPMRISRRISGSTSRRISTSPLTSWTARPRTSRTRPPSSGATTPATSATYTFAQMKDASNRAANFFKSVGIGKGDVVMLMLKRRAEFWFAVLGLHKIGAVAIPATHLLTTKDIVYRSNAADVKMIVAVDDKAVIDARGRGQPQSPTLKLKAVVGARADGLARFPRGVARRPRRSSKRPPAPTPPATRTRFFIYFTSGHDRHAQDGAAQPHLPARPHPHRQVLAERPATTASTSPSPTPAGPRHRGARSTASGSAAPRSSSTTTTTFVPKNMLSVITKYKLTTFCAPPTVFRFFIKEDLNAVRLQHLKYCVTAGEPLNPEVYNQFVERHRRQAHGRLRPDRSRGHGGDLPVGRAASPAPWASPRPATPSTSSTTTASPARSAKRGRSSSAPTSASRSGMFEEYYRDDGAHEEGLARRRLLHRRHGVARRGRLLLVRRAAPTTSSRAPATASAPSRSRARSWSTRRSSSAPSPACRTSCAARSSRRTVVLAKGYPAVGRAGSRASGPREEGHRALQVPAHNRVRDVAPQDHQRQDPPRGDPRQGYIRRVVAGWLVPGSRTRNA